MTEKLDKLSNDILTLLKNAEPNRLRHHEICDSLWKTYQYRYKDMKSFGVAVSQKLNLLKAKGLIIQEDIWYGTPNSTIPKTEAEKPSTETRIPVPENLLEVWEDIDYLSRQWKIFEPLKDLADIQRELRKKYIGVKG